MSHPEISVAAIDNGLAFPYKHPDEWRACKHDAGVGVECVDWSAQFASLSSVLGVLFRRGSCH